MNVSEIQRLNLWAMLGRTESSSPSGCVKDWVIRFGCLMRHETFKGYDMIQTH